MAHLSLSLLGPVQITLDDQQIAGLGNNKTQALLIYLVLEAATAHRRDALAALLWPEHSEPQARHNLSQTLLRLRHALSDHTDQQSFFHIDRTSIQFNRSCDVWIDVTAFTGILDACHHHAHDTMMTCDWCARRLREAVALYRGDFLSHASMHTSAPFEEWAHRLGSRLHQHMLTALALLARYEEQRYQYHDAIAALRQQLALEPWREPTHRHLMRLLMVCGERGAALAQYEDCRRILATEFGVEPEAETRRLYQQIRTDRAYAHQSAAAEPHPDMPFTAPDHHLPAPLTPLVGRTHELAHLSALLSRPDCRLITLVGPGGIGKTRLALEAAHHHLATFAHGVVFVALASVSDPALLAQVIGQSLACRFEGQGDYETRLLAYLRHKQMLLVLDNCEHLIAGDGLLLTLLQHAPGITLLVTSRKRLRLRAEWAIVVDGLPVHAPGAERDSMPEQADAVQLFLQCAQRNRSTFSITDANLPHIIRICRLLAGMPLGLEMAASWVHTRSCADIAREITQGIETLASTLRDMPARHRSLQVVCDHSWQILTTHEQHVTRKLAVFPGGFNYAAASRVASASRATLSALVDASWLQCHPDERYAMHEFLRQYARDQLQQSGDMTAVQDQHLMYYLQVAETAEPRLMSNAQLAVMAHLESELDNLRAALTWSQSAPHRTAAGLRIVRALGWFWYLRNMPAEGQRWAELTPAAPGAEQHPLLQAKARLIAGCMALVLGNAQTAYQQLTDSEAALAEAGDRWDQAMALAGLGQTLLYQGEPARAYSVLEQAIQCSRTSQNVTILSLALCLLGEVVLQGKEFARARQLFEESLAINRQLGDRLGTPYILYNLGLVAYYQHDLPVAEEYVRQTMTLAHELKLKRFLAMALQRSGWILLDQGKAVHAIAYFARALATFQELHHLLGIAGCLEGIARGAADLGETHQVAVLLGAAEALREQIDVPIFPLESPTQENTRTQICAQLGETLYDQLRHKGRRATLEQSLAHAFQVAQATGAVDVQAI